MTNDETKTSFLRYITKKAHTPLPDYHSVKIAIKRKKKRLYLLSVLK